MRIKIKRWQAQSNEVGHPSHDYVSKVTTPQVHQFQSQLAGLPRRCVRSFGSSSFSCLAHKSIRYIAQYDITHGLLYLRGRGMLGGGSAYLSGFRGFQQKIFTQGLNNLKPKG